MAEWRYLPSMWHIPKRWKRGFLVSGALALLIAFAGIRQDKGIIVAVSLGILTCIAIGFSDYLQKTHRNMPAFFFVMLLTSCLVGLAAWHVWPVPSVTNVSTPENSFTLFLNCQPQNYPITFSPESTIHMLDTNFSLSLSTVYTGPHETKFPRPDFNGFGYKCEALNYNDEPSLNLKGIFKVLTREIVSDKAGRRDGKLISTNDCTVKIPIIDAKGKWEFYLFNLNPDRFVEVIPPEKVTVEFRNKSQRVEVLLKRNDDVMDGHLLLSGPFKVKSPELSEIRSAANSNDEESLEIRCQNLADCPSPELSRRAIKYAEKVGHIADTYLAEVTSLNNEFKSLLANGGDDSVKKRQDIKRQADAKQIEMVWAYHDIESDVRAIHNVMSDRLGEHSEGIEAHYKSAEANDFNFYELQAIRDDLRTLASKLSAKPSLQ